MNGIYYNKDESNIENLLSKNKEIVIKAVNGGGGKDVFIINKDSNWKYAWIPVFAPILGAVLAALIFGLL